MLPASATGDMDWSYRDPWSLLIDTNPPLVNSITRQLSSGSSSCQMVENLRKFSYRLEIHPTPLGCRPNPCGNQLKLQEGFLCPINPISVLQGSEGHGALHQLRTSRALSAFLFPVLHWEPLLAAGISIHGTFLLSASLLGS